jgi:hypothetical protein
MNRQNKTDTMDQKEAARLRMQKLRAERKASETKEEKEARLKKQREDRTALRRKQNPNPRRKATPKAIQDYKVEGTQNQNLDRIFKLQRDLKISEDEIDFDILLDENIITDHIDSTYDNLNTRRSYYASLVKVLSDLGPDDKESLDTIENYRKLMKENKAVVDKELDTNTKSDKESEKWLEWTDVKKVSATSIEDPVEKLIYLLYTTIPPRRTEYRTLKISELTATQLRSQKDKVKNENYIVVTPSGTITKIVINDYKTAKSYGSYVIDMTKASPLKTALQKYIKGNDLGKGEYIFPATLRHESGWSKSVRDTFNNAVGKPLNINMLRKIYMSYINTLPPTERTQDKLKTIALAMGTSIEQLHTNYTKVDEDSDDE